MPLFYIHNPILCVRTLLFWGGALCATTPSCDSDYNMANDSMPDKLVPEFRYQLDSYCDSHCNSRCDIIYDSYCDSDCNCHRTYFGY